jgi:hypothetical protein
MRAADRLLPGVLDDDPTGSQAVHDVQVMTVLDESGCDAALGGPAATCFVLTNTRSLDERSAIELNMRAARGLIAVAGRRIAPHDHSGVVPGQLGCDDRAFRHGPARGCDSHGPKRARMGVDPVACSQTAVSLPAQLSPRTG